MGFCWQLEKPEARSFPSNVFNLPDQTSKEFEEKFCSSILMLQYKFPNFGGGGGGSNSLIFLSCLFHSSCHFCFCMDFVVVCCYVSFCDKLDKKYFSEIKQ